MQNVQSVPETALIILGGLVAETNAFNVPAGSSPVCCDCDFTVASVKTRDGLVSVYSSQSVQLAADNFTRANENPLNPANWTTSAGGFGPLAVVGDTCQATSLIEVCAEAYTGVVFPNDQYAQLTIGGINGVAGILSAIVRQTGQNGYYADITGPLGPGAQVNLLVATATTETVLATLTANINPGDVLRLSISGTSLTVTINGVTRISTNDSTFATGTPALGINETLNLAATYVTDFTAGSVGTGPSTGQFDYVKTFEMQNGGTLTLALDDAGTFWQEDVINNPGILMPFYSAIEPDTFAVSVTQDDREFIALSDLIQGTDIPRQYNGQWVDRISQVGPGAPPAVTFTATTYPIVASPLGVTQASAKVLGNGSDPLAGGFELLWSTGPGVATPGNVLTFYFAKTVNLATAGFLVGSVVVITGVQTVNTLNPNGTYIVTSVGTAPGLNNTGIFPIFTVQNTSSTFANVTIQAGAMYQFSLATVTTTIPVPNVQVGSQISLSGVGVGAWNATWTVTATPNAAQLQITATSLTSGVATYNFTLVSGSLPVVGEQVTVTGCTNGPQQPNGNSIFDVVNAAITSTGAGSFSVAIAAANVASASEASAQGIINGTIFQFDPGLADVGTMTSPIFGNSGGGTVSVPGGLTSGIRQCVVMFLTRNGFLTQPSPPVTFTLSASANSLVVSNIPIGPPNVIARVLAFTGGNGAFFFWIPVPVTVVSNGQNVTYSSTVIQDNTTTQVTLNFVDAVLLAATSIDSQGSNNFAQVELGSCTGVTAFAQRLVAWGEQNKVQNFINWSFDGGYQIPATGAVPEPLGWTVDALNGAGGQLLVSPLFGNSYYIKNATGSTQAAYGMIEQTAFQDYNKVAILLPQTEYSVRVTARSPALAASGNLVIDLYSPSFGKAFGTATFPLANMITTMQVFTGTLLTTAFATQIPADLLLRVWAQNIPNGGDVEIDREEVFDPSQPTLSTQLRVSYFDNFEAFDGVTGNLGVGSQNQQPVRNAFQIFDNLYIIRSRSIASTTDNGITEPNGWTVREVSNKVGTPSIHGVDVGEGWALVAGESGLYLFDGGQPQKISPELDANPGPWQTINWKYGYTLWIKNDTDARRILIGVPMVTPNKWMPNFPANANPTQPNVVLMCNYKELMSSNALKSEGPIRLSYAGELRSYALGRKWSAWSIEACYADFIDRPDTTMPAFFCGDAGTGKIYQQLAGTYADDGQAMHCKYITYGFPKTQEAEQKQMGLNQLEAVFLSTLVIGNGNLDITIYPDTIESPYANALLPEPMYNPPPFGDTETPLNETGNRFFVGYEVDQPGEFFEISKVVMAIKPSSWAPVRGSN